MTIREFAETVLKLTGSRSEVTYEPLPTDDPQVRQPDISQAREKLGWEPRVGLEEGLARTIEFFQEAGY
jgi:nucleoside-diphosphate-sugar epimerase